MNKSELLPCPFCGGEARHYALGPIDHHIECTNPKCYAVTHGWSTEAEAIAAWNTRLKRYPESLAQRMIVDGYEYELFELRKEFDKLKELNDYYANATLDDSQAERTCHIEERYGNQYCTCCGEMVGTWDSTSELYIDGNMVELWNYCPNCGAKVVDE